MGIKLSSSLFVLALHNHAIRKLDLGITASCISKVLQCKFPQNIKIDSYVSNAKYSILIDLFSCMNTKIVLEHFMMPKTSLLIGWGDIVV